MNVKAHFVLNNLIADDFTASSEVNFQMDVHSLKHIKEIRPTNTHRNKIITFNGAYRIWEKIRRISFYLNYLSYSLIYGRRNDVLNKITKFNHLCGTIKQYAYKHKEGDAPEIL